MMLLGARRLMVLVNTCGLLVLRGRSARGLLVFGGLSVVVLRRFGNRSLRAALHRRCETRRQALHRAQRDRSTGPGRGGSDLGQRERVQPDVKRRPGQPREFGDTLPVHPGPVRAAEVANPNLVPIEQHLGVLRRTTRIGQHEVTYLASDHAARLRELAMFGRFALNLNDDDERRC
jgi:hypothetical protein